MSVTVYIDHVTVNISKSTTKNGLPWGSLIQKNLQLTFMEYIWNGRSWRSCKLKGCRILHLLVDGYTGLTKHFPTRWWVPTGANGCLWLRGVTRWMQASRPWVLSRERQPPDNGICTLNAFFCDSIQSVYTVYLYMLTTQSHNQNSRMVRESALFLAP